MSETTATKPEKKSIAVALISAFATIVAAVIGLAANWLPPKQDSTTPDKKVNETPPAQVRQVPPSQTTSTSTIPVRLTDETPISISYRKSNIPGYGMVLGLTNTSSKETLRKVVVTVQSSKDEQQRSYRVSHPIKPGDSIAVGWKELQGWKLQPGDAVKITVDGRRAPVESVVPQS